jgi:hypothetical protein
MPASFGSSTHCRAAGMEAAESFVGAAGAVAARVEAATAATALGRRAARRIGRAG